MPSTVLIVEDDPELGSIFYEILTDYIQMGLETEWITDGQQALARLKESVPDLVMLDLHLPGISGLNVLKYIRSDERLARTVVVVITADITGARAAEELADKVLVKPIGIDQIISFVTQTLGADADK